MTTCRILALSALAWLSAAAVGAGEAAADQHRYAGAHPIPGTVTGAYCYIEAPHVHVYAPVKAKVLYRDYDGWAHFVGDPSPYGYDGDRHAYHGAHPIAMDVRVEVEVDEPAPEHVTYCYLKGPHYHGYEPAVADFEVKGDVHWYVGEFPDRFHERRRAYARVNAIYADVDYERPVVEVEPPHAYTDVLVEVEVPAASARGRARGRGRPHVGGGIGVDVHIPVPSFKVEVGGGHRHHHGKHKHRKFKHRKHKHRKHRRGYR